MATAVQDAFLFDVTGLTAGGPGNATGGGATQDSTDSHPVLDPPVIAVKNIGDGSFQVTGHGFLHSESVTITVAGFSADKSAWEPFPTTSTADGAIDYTTQDKVTVPAQLFFRATDSRSAWSNTVYLIFPGVAPAPDDPDAPDDPPADPPADQPADPPANPPADP